MSQEVNSIEELIAGGISELQTLAGKGNTLAQEWLRIIEKQADMISKLAMFGEIRVALMDDESAEARQVYEALWLRKAA